MRASGQPTEESHALAERAWEALAPVPLTRGRGSFAGSFSDAATGLRALVGLPAHVLAAIPVTITRVAPDHQLALASDVQAALPDATPVSSPGRAARRERVLANHLAFADELSALSRDLVGFAYGAVAQDALIIREADAPDADSGAWRLVETDYLTVASGQRDEAAAFIVAAHLTALRSVEFDDALGSGWVRRAELAERPSEELVAVVRRHLGSCAQLVQTAVERESLEPGMLDEVLSAPAGTLASGAL